MAKGVTELFCVLSGICLLITWLIIGLIEYMMRITQNYSSSFIELFLAYSFIGVGVYGLYIVKEIISWKLK